MYHEILTGPSLFCSSELDFPPPRAAQSLRSPLQVDVSMGASASFTLPTEYEKLTDDEKKAFQTKFDQRVSDGAEAQEAFNGLYKETLELIAKMASSDKYDVEGAKEKLAVIKAEEAKRDAAIKYAFVGGVCKTFKLTELENAIEHAVALRLTPLIIDDSEDNKVDTYMSYGNGVLLDAKKLGLDRSMRSVPLNQLMNEAREKLVNALRYGNRLVVAMTKSCTDFVGVFTDESLEAQKEENDVDLRDDRSCFPSEVFRGAGRALIDDKWLEKLFRDEEKEQGKFALARDPEKFCTVCTTQFSVEDFEEFLWGNDDYGMPGPKEQYAFIVIGSATEEK